MKKEIVLTALRHEKPPIVPHYFGLTQGARQKLEAHYGDSSHQAIDNFLSVYYLDRPQQWRREPHDIIRDMWGIPWDRSVDKDIGVPATLLFPEPDMRYWNPPKIDEGLFEPLKEFIQENRQTFTIVSLSYFTLYDRAWALRGTENLLMDMTLHPQFVHDLLDALTDWSVQAARGILAVPGVDALHFNDDWGQQTGLTMGMPFWQEFLHPRLKRLYGVVKEAGAYLSIHSCGKVQELFPSLIDLGVDLFNPFQPEVMDVPSLFRSYRGKLSFWGGLSVQRTLPLGSPADVRREVIDLWNMGREGGYILSPSHDITSDVPIENLVALVETVRELEQI